MLGLIDAVDKFDPSLGIPFERYAPRRITGAMIDGLRQDDWAPRRVRHRARQLEAAAGKLSVLLGREATDEELAASLETDVGDVRAVRRDTDLASVGRIEVESGEESATVERIDHSLSDPQLELELAEVARMLSYRLAALNDQHRTILALVVMERMTLTDVARILGVSETRVCQIHPQALNELRP